MKEQRTCGWEGLAAYIAVLCCAQVWRQQNSSCWYDNPLIAQDCLLLSPECIDLLNKMFQLDSDKR